MRGECERGRERERRGRGGVWSQGRQRDQRKEDEGQRERHKIDIFSRCEEKTGARPQIHLDSDPAAPPHVAETSHLSSVWVTNDRLWSNQTACHRDMWVSEQIWQNAHRPAYHAASINLHHQIKHAGINPDQLGNMQITPLGVKDGAAVSEVDGNSAVGFSFCPKWLSTEILQIQMSAVIAHHSVKCSYGVRQRRETASCKCQMRQQ